MDVARKSLVAALMFALTLAAACLACQLTPAQKKVVADVTNATLTVAQIACLLEKMGVLPTEQALVEACQIDQTLAPAVHALVTQELAQREAHAHREMAEAMCVMPAAAWDGGRRD